MSVLVKFEQLTKSGMSYHYGESVEEVLQLAFPDIEKQDLVQHYIPWFNTKGFDNTYIMTLPQIGIHETKKNKVGLDYIVFHGLIYADELL